MKTTKNGQEVQLRNDLVAKGLKALQGNDDPVLFERLKQVAELYSQFGGYEQSLVIREKLYENRKEILGGNHPDTLKELDELEEVKGKIG